MRYCKDPRIKDTLGIAVNIIEGLGEGLAPVRTLHMTEDISRNGLRFRHERALPIDSFVRILVLMDAPSQVAPILFGLRW